MGYFELIAECSVALGGFAAVHAALRGSTGPRGTYRAWGTVSFAFTAMLMALVPVLAELQGELSTQSWRWIHGIGATLALSCLCTNRWIDFRLDAAGQPAQHRIVLRAVQGVQLLGSLILLLTLLGVPPGPGPLPYALALLAPFVSGLSGIIVSFWLALRDAIELAEKG